jgi:hypothetical protein
MSSGCSVVYSVYKEVCVLWGASVLLLKDEKNTATLRVTINDQGSDGK